MQCQVSVQACGQGEGEGECHLATVDAVGGEDEVALSQLGALLGAPRKRASRGGASFSGRSAHLRVARGVALSGRQRALLRGV